MDKMWKDMTDQEKGALLLAAHKGEPIEYSGNSYEWIELDHHEWSDKWFDNLFYRVKAEPKVETVVLFGNSYPERAYGNWFDEGTDTHTITFNTIDGEPDCSSVRMEKL